MRHDSADRGRNKKRLHAEINQTCNGRGRIIGVQRAEYKMASETGVGCDACSLEIANFADHNDVRRLAQDGTQRGRKSHADFGIHLHLIDPRHLVFDRFFDRNDFAVRFVDVIETGVKRGRLAGAGRPSHEENPVRHSDQALEAFLVV